MAAPRCHGGAGALRHKETPGVRVLFSIETADRPGPAPSADVEERRPKGRSSGEGVRPAEGAAGPGGSPARAWGVSVGRSGGVRPRESVKVAPGRGHGRISWVSANTGVSLGSFAGVSGMNRLNRSTPESLGVGVRGGPQVADN